MPKSNQLLLGQPLFGFSGMFAELMDWKKSCYLTSGKTTRKQGRHW
ncbi:hypothetical protein [Anoxybacter fermentans]|nr:hypothetical protein [Anoxybacter fermentans]